MVVVMVLVVMVVIVLLMVVMVLVVAVWGWWWWWVDGGGANIVVGDATECAVVDTLYPGDGVSALNAECLWGKGLVGISKGGIGLICGWEFSQNTVLVEESSLSAVGVGGSGLLGSQ